MINIEKLLKICAYPTFGSKSGYDEFRAAFDTATCKKILTELAAAQILAKRFFELLTTCDCPGNLPGDLSWEHPKKCSSVCSGDKETHECWKLYFKEQAEKE